MALTVTPVLGTVAGFGVTPEGVAVPETPLISRLNRVTKPRYGAGRVYINDIQYFDGVPQVAWEFYIGGYQPAQKWLKDRKERVLGFEEILHY